MQGKETGAATRFDVTFDDRELGMTVSAPTAPSRNPDVRETPEHDSRADERPHTHVGIAAQVTDVGGITGGGEGVVSAVIPDGAAARLGIVLNDRTAAP